MNDLFNLSAVIGFVGVSFIAGYMVHEEMTSPKPIKRSTPVVEPILNDPRPSAKPVAPVYGWHSYLCRDKDCKHPQHGRKIGLY